MYSIHLCICIFFIYIFYSNCFHFTYKTFISIPCNSIYQLNSMRRADMEESSSKSKSNYQKNVRTNNINPRRSNTIKLPSLQDNIRISRYARSLRDELSDIICNADIKATNYPEDSLLQGTSIVDVEVSTDLMNVKVILSVLGNSVQKRQVYVWLSENVGQVRFSLAKRLKHIRRVPIIVFKLMDSQTSDMMDIFEQEEMRRANKKRVLDDTIEFDEDD